MYTSFAITLPLALMFPFALMYRVPSVASCAILAWITSAVTSLRLHFPAMTVVDLLLPM